MKKIYTLLFTFISILIYSQQVSLMQPAIKNSDLKLDSIFVRTDYVFRSSVDYPTEKWYIKSYDSDKNPTEFMVYHIKELIKATAQNSIDVSSLKTGVYFMKFKTENGFINKQLIIK